MPNPLDKLKDLTPEQRAALGLLSGNPIAASAFIAPETTASAIDMLKNGILRGAGVANAFFKIGKGIAYDIPKALGPELKEVQQKHPILTVLNPAAPILMSDTGQNIATLGIKPTIQKAAASVKPPRTPTELLTKGAEVTGKAVYDYFGFNSLEKAFASDDPMVQGEEFTQGLLQLLPIVGVASKLAGAGRASILTQDIARSQTLAKGKAFIRNVDVDNPQSYIKGKLLHEKDLFRPDEAPVRQPTPSINTADKATTVPGDLLSNYQVAVIGNDVISNLAHSLLAVPDNVSTVVVNALKNGALAPERIKQLLPTLKATSPEEATRAISDAVLHTAHQQGSGLNVWSELETLREARLFIAKRRGDPEAVKAWTEASKSAAGNSISVWKDIKAMDTKAVLHDVWETFRKYESARKATGTSGPGTTGRNIITQGMQFGVTQFDAFLQSTLERMGFLGKAGDPTHAFTRATESIVDLLRGTAEASANYKGAHRLLKETPFLEDMLLKSPMSIDARATAAVAGRVIGAPGVVDHYINAAQFLNFTQEVAFRKMLFGTRVPANLKRFGISMEEADRLLKTPLDGLSKTEATHLTQVKQSMAEAYHWALKNTFADNPITKTGQQVLAIFQNPIMTALGHPFPRFLANKMSWLSRRNPAHLLELVDPRFRGMLNSSDPLLQQAAREAVTQATSGMMMLAAVKAVRNSPIAGQKYFEFYGVNSDGSVDRSKVKDIRAWDPFTALAGIVSVWESVANNKPTNLDANEWTDLVLGIRRINDLGFTGIATAAQSLLNQEVFAKGMARVAAGHSGMWTIPITTLKRLWWDMDAAASAAKDALAKEGIKNDPIVAALLGPGYGAPSAAIDIMTSPVGTAATDIIIGKDRSKPWAYPELTGEDTAADVLTAPWRQALGDAPVNIYNALSSTNKIPATPSRISQWTGAPDVTAEPVLTQLGATPVRKLTPLVDAMNRIGLDEREMRKNYKTSEANNTFAVEFNKILKTPNEAGTTLEDTLTQIISKLADKADTTDPKKRAMFRNTAQFAVTRGILGKVTSVAERSAIAQKPEAFLIGKIGNMPLPVDIKSEVKEIFRDLYKNQRVLELTTGAK